MPPPITPATSFSSRSRSMQKVVIHHQYQNQGSSSDIFSSTTAQAEKIKSDEVVYGRLHYLRQNHWIEEINPVLEHKIALSQKYLLDIYFEKNARHLMPEILSQIDDKFAIPTTEQDINPKIHTCIQQAFPFYEPGQHLETAQEKVIARYGAWMIYVSLLKQKGLLQTLTFYPSESEHLREMRLRKHDQRKACYAEVQRRYQAVQDLSATDPSRPKKIALWQQSHQEYQAQRSHAGDPLINLSEQETTERVGKFFSLHPGGELFVQRGSGHRLPDYIRKALPLVEVLDYIVPGTIAKLPNA